MNPYDEEPPDSEEGAAPGAGNMYEWVRAERVTPCWGEPPDSEEGAAPGAGPRAFGKGAAPLLKAQSPKDAHSWRVLAVAQRSFCKALCLCSALVFQKRSACAPSSFFESAAPVLGARSPEALRPVLVLCADVRSAESISPLDKLVPWAQLRLWSGCYAGRLGQRGR
eukprot:337981-Chlamydomonas_euryale.AAC.1